MLQTITFKQDGRNFFSDLPLQNAVQDSYCSPPIGSWLDSASTLFDCVNIPMSAGQSQAPGADNGENFHNLQAQSFW
jgi:hypothetical protein